MCLESTYFGACVWIFAVTFDNLAMRFQNEYIAQLAYVCEKTKRSADWLTQHPQPTIHSVRALYIPQEPTQRIRRNLSSRMKMQLGRD